MVILLIFCHLFILMKNASLWIKQITKIEIHAKLLLFVYLGPFVYMFVYFVIYLHILIIYAMHFVFMLCFSVIVM